MNNLKRHITLLIGFSIIVVVLFTGSALGQSGSSRVADGTTTINSTNTPAVEPKQSSAWSIGLNAASRDAPARRPFQMRAAINIPVGGSVESGFLPIPAGKRLVIENVSAVARCPEGMRMEIKYFTWFDNGDGVGDPSNDITFHRIALTDQGTIVGSAVSAANHKVLVFADELIGTSHFQIGIQVNLSGVATQVAQGQITFSGYMEDLPVAP